MGGAASRESAALFVIVIRARQLLRAGGPSSRAAQVMFVAWTAATALFGLNAIALMSLAAYGLALMLQLCVAAISFYSLLADSD